MILKDIYNILDEISPFSLQEKWDNSGLMLGSFTDQIKNIYLSIDIDMQMLENMEENSLIITHHPIIFSGIKSFNTDIYPSNLLNIMIKKNISNIAMHTNFDKTHLNDYVSSKILGLEVYKKDEFVNYMRCDIGFDQLVEKVKKAFCNEKLKYVKCKDKISTIALCTGAGASMLNEIDADVFLTGDIKYHDAMAAKSMDLSLIDVKHFESESFFAQIMLENLKKYSLSAIISQSKNPFTYV